MHHRPSNICHRAHVALCPPSEVKRVQWRKTKCQRVTGGSFGAGVFEPSAAHSFNTLGPFGNKEPRLCEPFLYFSLRGVFEHIPAKCYWAGVVCLTLWDLGFDLAVVNTAGGISHAPIVNLPVLFTNTDHDNRPGPPVRIASDIICPNLLKAHVDCRSLE